MGRAPLETTRSPVPPVRRRVSSSSPLAPTAESITKSSSSSGPLERQSSASAAAGLDLASSVGSAGVATLRGWRLCGGGGSAGVAALGGWRLCGGGGSAGVAALQGWRWRSTGAPWVRAARHTSSPKAEMGPRQEPLSTQARVVGPGWQAQGGRTRLAGPGPHKTAHQQAGVRLGQRRGRVQVGAHPVVKRLQRARHVVRDEAVQ